MTNNNVLLKLKTHPNIIPLTKLFGKVYRLKEKRQLLEQTASDVESFKRILLLSDKIDEISERIHKLL